MDQLVEDKKNSTLFKWMIVIGWLGMMVFAFHASTHMVGAGDTWVAMACGRHFIDHGVDTVEPFSANSHKAGPTQEDIENWPGPAKWIAEKVGLDTVKYWHPTGWVNQNWLTHVIFYWLTHESPFADAEELSFNSVVYWKFAIYIITVICVYYTGRLLGAHPALSAIFACFAMFAGRSFLDIRPAGFSNMLTAVFLLVLALTTYRNILYIWLIVPLTAFWCNLHGGYIYVFIMLTPFVALNLLTSIFQKRFISIGLRGVIHTIAAGFCAFLASIIFNPFHLTNLTHTFVISVSEHAKMWRTVNEWHPAFEWRNPVGTSFPFLVLLILSIGVVVFWLFSRFLKPKLLKAPKNEIESQEKLFKNLSTIFGCTAAIFIGWVTFVSFSFLNLDVTSWFFCAVFIGILLLSVYKSVHFVYLTVLLTLLALWSSNSDANYVGRYIYPFVILPSYVTLHIIISLLSKNVKFKPKNIIYVTFASVAALILMMTIINPFKLEWNQISDQLLNIQRLWRPIYEGKKPLDYTYLFPVLYFINIASIILWLTLPYLQKLFALLAEKPAEQSETHTYTLPKIDLAPMAIAALTIYMAIRSRRFISIAPLASCPVLAILIYQISCTISASRNFYTRGRLSIPPLSLRYRAFFVFAGSVAVLAFGTWWSLKFKRVYLGPWPTDTKLNSVFMRMTASDAKPFDACNFIKQNKMNGKMFNYWTEGGFIAWGQQPDPNTGKTPLQLFMDGRAQAAYERESYETWANIMSGGPTAKQARIRKHKLNSKDYLKIGNWISAQLRAHDVWTVFNVPVNPVLSVPAWNPRPIAFNAASKTDI